MAEKRIKVTIDKTGNFEVEAVKGFANGECHNTVEAIIAGSGAEVADSRSYDDHCDEPNLIANLR